MEVVKAIFFASFVLSAVLAETESDTTTTVESNDFRSESVGSLKNLNLPDPNSKVVKLTPNNNDRSGYVENDCYCNLKREYAGPTVSEKLNPTGEDDVERLVVHLYRVKKNPEQVYVYIPDRKKQYAAPDLELSPYDLLEEVTSKVLRDFLKNNPYVLKRKRFPNVPDFGVDGVSYNKHRVRQYRERFVYQFARPKNPYVFLFENLVTYPKKLPRVFKKLCKELYYTIKQHPEYLSGPEGSKVDFNELYHSYEKEHVLTDLLPPPYKPGQQFELPSLFEFEPGTFDKNRPIQPAGFNKFGVPKHPRPFESGTDVFPDFGKENRPAKEVYPELETLPHPGGHTHEVAVTPNHHHHHYHHHQRPEKEFFFITNPTETPDSLVKPTYNYHFGPHNTSFLPARPTDVPSNQHPYPDFGNTLYPTTTDGLDANTLPARPLDHPDTSVPDFDFPSGFTVTPDITEFDKLTTNNYPKRPVKLPADYNTATGPDNGTDEDHHSTDYTSASGPDDGTDEDHHSTDYTSASGPDDGTDEDHHSTDYTSASGPDDGTDEDHHSTDHFSYTCCGDLFPTGFEDFGLPEHPHPFESGHDLLPDFHKPTTTDFLKAQLPAKPDHNHVEKPGTLDQFELPGTVGPFEQPSTFDHKPFKPAPGSEPGHDHKPTSVKFPAKPDLLPAKLPAKPGHDKYELPSEVLTNYPSKPYEFPKPYPSTKLPARPGLNQFGHFDLPSKGNHFELPSTVHPFERPNKVNQFELPSKVNHKPAPGFESGEDLLPEFIPGQLPTKPGHDKFELPSTAVTNFPFKPYDFSKPYPSTKLPARPGHNHGGNFKLPSKVHQFEFPSTVYPFELPSHKPAPGFESGEDLLPEFLPGQFPAKPGHERFELPSTFVTEHPFKPYDFSKPYPSTKLPARPGHNHGGNLELPSKVNHFELPSTVHHKPAPGFESGENLLPDFTYPEKTKFLPGQLPAKPGYDKFELPSTFVTNFPFEPYDFSKPYPSTKLPARPGHNHGGNFKLPSKVHQFEFPSTVYPFELPSHKPAPGFESGEDLLPEFLPGQFPAKPGHERFELPSTFVTEHPFKPYDFSKPYPSTKLPARPGHNHGGNLELPSKVNHFELPSTVHHKPAPGFESGENLLPDFTYPEKTKFLPGQLPAKPGHDKFELPSTAVTNFPFKPYDFSKPYPSTKLPARPGHNHGGNFKLPSKVHQFEFPSTVYPFELPSHKPAPGFESGEDLLPEFLPGQFPAKPGHERFELPSTFVTEHPFKPYDFSKPYPSTKLPARPGHNHGGNLELPSKVNHFELPSTVHHKPAPGFESGENLLPDFTYPEKTKFLPGQLPAKPGYDKFELPSTAVTNFPFEPYDFSKPYPSTKLPARPGHNHGGNFKSPSKVHQFEFPSTVYPFELPSHKPAPGFESGVDLLPEFLPGQFPAKPGHERFELPSTFVTEHPFKPYDFSRPYPSTKLPARPGHNHGGNLELPSKVNHFELPSTVHHKPAPGFGSGENLLPDFTYPEKTKFLPGQLPAKPGYEKFELPSTFVTDFPFEPYDFSKPYPSTKLPARPGHNHGGNFKLPSKVHQFEFPSTVYPFELPSHKPAPGFESGEDLLPEFLPGQFPAKPGHERFELPSTFVTDNPFKPYDFSKPYPSTKLPARPGHNHGGNLELPSKVNHFELPSTVHHKPAPGFESGENLLPDFTYPEKTKFLPGQLPAKPGYHKFELPSTFVTNFPFEPYDFSKPYPSTKLPARPGHNHGGNFKLPSKVHQFEFPSTVYPFEPPSHKPAPGFESGEDLLPEFLPGQFPAKPGHERFELPSTFVTEHPFKPYDFSKPYPSTKLPARPGHNHGGNLELPSKVNHFELPSTVHHKPAPGFESGENLLPDFTHPEKTKFLPGQLPAKPGYDKFELPSSVETNYPSKPFDFSKPYPSTKLPAQPGQNQIDYFDLPTEVDHKPAPGFELGENLLPGFTYPGKTEFLPGQLPSTVETNYPSKPKLPARPGHNHGGFFELPSKVNHIELPGSVNHFVRPSKGENFELPASVNQFELPSEVNHFVRPSKGYHFEVPGSVNHFERPSKGENFVLPGSVNHFERPSKGENFVLPGSVNHFQLPASVNQFELPSNVNHFERPSKVNHFELPSEVSHFERPSKNHFELPGLVNHFERPSKGEHFERPSEGFHFEVPGSVNYFERPSKGFHFEVPGSVNYFERPSKGYHFEVPGSVNHFERPSKVNHFELPGSVHHFERPSKGERFELPGKVNQFELPSKVNHFELPGSVNEQYPGFKYETTYNDYNTDSSSHKPYPYPSGPPGNLHKDTNKEYFGTNQLHYETDQTHVYPVDTNSKIIRENYTFDSWFEKEFASFGTQFKENSNLDGGFDIGAVKQLIQSVLKSNGIAITKRGFLVSSDGQPLNTRELKLRPILVGNAIGLHTLLSKSKLKIPPHSYFLNILVTFGSSKVLGVVPVGKSNAFALNNVQTKLPATVKVVKTGGYEENSLASAHQPYGTVVRYTIKRPVFQHGRVVYSKPKLQQYKFFLSGNSKAVGDNLAADLLTSQVKAKTQVHLNKLNLGAKKLHSSKANLGVNLNTQGLFNLLVSKNGQSKEQAQSGEATLNERSGNDENVEDVTLNTERRAPEDKLPPIPDTNPAKKEETKVETTKVENNRDDTELRLDEEKEQAKEAPTEHPDSDERKEQTESLPAFRIMGGNAATQSGSAIKGRGRSGRG